MAGSVTRKALVSVALVALVLTIGAVQSTAQSFPSQEQAPMKQKILRVPEILSFLEEGSARSHEIMHNVTAANFKNAAANVAAYRKVADNFSAWQKNEELDYAVVHDVSTSSDLFGQLVVKAERYDTVYKEQLSNGTSDLRSNQSANNALELKTLSSEIQALSDQLNATNDRISGTAMSQGTDLSDATTEQAFDNYVAALNIRTQNMTDLVFRNTTTSLRATSLSADKRELHFGDLVDLSGNVSDGNVSVSNATVHLSVGGKRITILSTDAAGRYDYKYAIADVPAGNQTFSAVFYPQDAPYKKSEGSATFAVSNVSAQNTLRLRSGSPLTKLSFEGVVTADGKPVKNATVQLYGGDKFAGEAITDGNGAYEMTYGMNRFNVLASLLQPSSVTFRATLPPGTYPLEGVASNAVSVPLLGESIAANPAPTAAGALVAIALIVLSVFRTYRRRSKKAAATAAVESTAPTTDVLRPLVGARVGVPAEDTSRTRATAALENVDVLVNRARALCSEGAENQAVIALYGGAISLAAELSGLVFERGKTHRERLALIEQSKPMLGEPLRALTSLFELARYSNRKLSPNHVDAAIDTLIVLSGLGRRPETEGA